MKPDRKFIYVSLFTLSWALAIFFRKLALNLGAHPVAFLMQSGLVSVSILTTYIALLKRKQLKKIKKHTLKELGFMGLLVGFAWIADTWGLKLTTSINYSFIIKSGFVFSIIFAYIFFGEKITKHKMYLIILFLVGVYFLTTGGTSIIPKAGDLLVILAALFYSGSTIMQKNLVKQLDSDIVAWIRTSSAVFVLGIFLSFIHLQNFAIVEPVYIVIVGALLALTTIYLNKALTVSSVTYLTMMTMTVPVLNVLLGTFILHESITSIQLVGGVIILLSAGVVQFLKI